MRERIESYISQWRRQGYSHDIPDEVPDVLMDEGFAPSYKAIAIAILRNDHHMTALGFQAPRSAWYDAIKRIEIKQRNNEP
jgi:predicted phosphoadenosine phosphosulfate sulfurtransferase